MVPTRFRLRRKRGLQRARKRALEDGAMAGLCVVF